MTLITFSCNSNNKTPKKISDHNFQIPKGWQSESITFPIDFAPQIPYTGIEELRFAPGWEFTSSEEHWCYTFLWWLNGNPKIDQNILQENLTAYYNGLVASNIIKRSIPAAKVIPAVAAFNKIETATDDTETYNGTITITDYLDIMFNPIILNCLVHKKNCSGHTALIFEISPKHFNHQIWQQLNKLNSDFKCVN
jgi:hypothetical protein